MRDIPEDCDTNRSVRRKILQVLKNNPALVLVALRGPVVIQIIQNLDTAVKLVENVSKETSLSKSLDGV